MPHPPPPNPSEESSKIVGKKREFSEVNNASLNESSKPKQ
jgi:hypothetical protein